MNIKEFEENAIKCLAGFSENLKDKLERLKKYKEDLEMIILPEHKFKVVK